MKHSLPLLLIALFAVTLAVPAEDRVTAIKGYYDFTGEFQMYSGYLNLQQNPLVSAHYVFITSKNKPQTDDLVLWFNGGPGCSSMLGFIQQFGPHVLNQGADTLAPHKNQFSWNNNANIIFIESPPGVGFSINQDPNYKVYNDTKTAEDNLQAVKVWFTKFPQFKNHRFWISGQSYAGMYVPELADLLIKNQDSIIEGGKLNFQGMIIGNGAMTMDLYWRTKVPVTYFSTHYYFGPEILSLLKTCKYDASDDANPSCQMGLKLADESTERINGYNPIGICYNIQPFGNSLARRKYRYTPFYKGLMSSADDEPDCDTDDSGMIKFFNDPTVQQQLHVQPTKWTPCSDKVGQVYTYGTTTIPLFQTFKKAGLKILLYSGNVDAVVPYYETDEYLKQIGWKIVKPKQGIKNPRGSLEAWVTTYQNNLVYYVVNAAGHMVPCEKPDATLKMFENFIYGKL